MILPSQTLCSGQFLADIRENHSTAGLCVNRAKVSTEGYNPYRTAKKFAFLILNNKGVLEFCSPLIYLYGGKLQIHGIYIIYALKHIVFGILVKKYFVTLQLIHKHRLNRL